MREFDLIASCFKPLAAGFPGSLNLTDDAAVLDVPEGMQLVVTKDAMVAGVHFLGTETPDLIARKLLRSNLSDLAGMGAAPWCYFVAGALPKDLPEEWLHVFAAGLYADQETFGIHLAGGDTTATPGPLTLSVTAMGLVPKGAALTRSGAKPGDLIYVSGMLGDAALGLQMLRGEAPRDEYFIERYLMPQPKLALGQQLRGVAHACMDISDGLVQDLGHICAASGVGAIVKADFVPRYTTVPCEMALTGGDDYELLFTSPNTLDMEGITCIGNITNGSGVTVVDAQGKKMSIAKGGYQHF